MKRFDEYRWGNAERQVIMATKYLAFHFLSRPMLSFRKLERCVLPILSSKYQVAASTSPCQHTARRKLHILDASLKTIPDLCLSLKSRVCNMCQASPPVRVGRGVISSFLLIDKDQKLFRGCSTSQTTTKASRFCSTSASSSDRKPGAGLITLIETEADLEAFLTQVKSELNLAKSSKTYAASMQNLRLLVQKLISLDCDCRSVLALLLANPGILSVRMDRLLSNIDYLHMLGLNWRRLLKSLDGNMALWKASLKLLQRRVKQLRKLGLVEGQLQKLISDWPQVLTVQSAQLNAVVKVLMEKCGFSRAEVLTILIDSPAVLAEDLEMIELHFQYAYFRMGIQNNSEMTQAKIFKYSLDHLRCRHLILERLGLYAAPNNRGQFAMKNPKLSRIIDSSDGRFTEKVAKISMEDYEAFAKTLSQEIEVQKLGKEGAQHGGDIDEFTDEDSQYDSDDDADSDSDYELSHNGVADTEPFDFDKVDFRKKR